MLNSAGSSATKAAEEGMADAAAGADAAVDPVVAERRRVIEATLEEIRPNLKRDGGDCELLDVQGDKVFVKMTGACVGCQLSSLTLTGVQAKLVEATGRMIRVIPVGPGGLPKL
ncbi:NifU family protein [Methylovirgula sp. HY1]|uniref:NifU family protein n=1 Tax=Methylovirgula sp. HY1 TaxID=2822761 RepID=UPI001C5AEACF|nr:Fe/S biogenesis protein NfuA [Methylovirgula sp. HY1]